MKKWLTASVALHVSVVLIFGLWVCPWFEKFTPAERFANIDVDVLKLGKETGLGEKAPKPPAPRETKQSASKSAPSKEDVPVAPAKPSEVEASAAPSGEASVTIEADGKPLTFTPADYLRWVMSRNPQPRYPRLANMRGEQGRVIVRVVIPPTGKPVRAELASSSGSELLDRAALETLQSWTFPPYMGRNELTLNFPFRFSLDER